MINQYSASTKRGHGSKLWRNVVVLAAAGLMLTGCSSGAPASGGTSAPPKETAVQVMDTQGTSAGFIQFTIDQGIFKHHGLSVSLQPEASGGSSVPALIAGQIQFAGSGVTSLISALSKGLPLSYVAPGAVATTKPGEASSTLYAKAGSGIKSIKDLAGKRVAVCALHSMCDLPVTVALENAGMKATDVQFQEIPFPNIMGAIQDGTVDAGMLIEPFRTLAAQAGLYAVSEDLYGEIDKGIQVSAYATSDTYRKAHPDVVKAFQASLADTVAAIDADPAAFRTFLVKYAKMPASVATDVSLPAWSVRGNPGAWAILSKEMLKLGWISTMPDLKKFGVQP